MPDGGTGSDECFVCRKHRGEMLEPGGPIYDDGVVRAGHMLPSPDGAPVYLGYLFVEPRRHAAGLGDLADHEAEAVGRLITRLSRTLVRREGAAHVYAFVFGDNVPHLHVHLVPRYPGAPREYWGVQVTDWPDAPRGGAEEIRALADRLRAELAHSA